MLWEEVTCKEHLGIMSITMLSLKRKNNQNGAIAGIVTGIVRENARDGLMSIVSASLLACIMIPDQMGEQRRRKGMDRLDFIRRAKVLL